MREQFDMNPFSGAASRVISLCKSGNIVAAIKAYNGAPDAAGATVLLSSFAKSSSHGLDTAFSIYYKLAPLSQLNVSVFRSMVKICSLHKEHAKTLTLWADMHTHSIVPDEVCFGSFALACGIIGEHNTAVQLLDFWASNGLQFQPSSTHCNNLIKALGAGGKLNDLRRIWNQIGEHQIQVNAVMYTVIFSACAQIGPSCLPFGKQIHSHLLQHGVALDLILVNSLINMYVKYGQYNDALTIFSQLPRNGIQPDAVTYSSMLIVCGNLGNLNMGRQIHSQIDSKGIPLTPFLLSALIGMYGRCNQIQNASAVWSQFTARHLKLETMAYLSILTLCTEVRELGLQFGEQVIIFLPSLHLTLGINNNFVDPQTH